MSKDKVFTANSDHGLIPQIREGQIHAIILLCME